MILCNALLWLHETFKSGNVNSTRILFKIIPLKIEQEQRAYFWFLVFCFLFLFSPCHSIVYCTSFCDYSVKVSYFTSFDPVHKLRSRLFGRSFHALTEENPCNAFAPQRSTREKQSCLHILKMTMRMNHTWVTNNMVGGIFPR